MKKITKVYRVYNKSERDVMTDFVETIYHSHPSWDNMQNDKSNSKVSARKLKEKYEKAFAEHYTPLNLIRNGGDVLDTDVPAIITAATKAVKRITDLKKFLIKKCDEIIVAKKTDGDVPLGQAPTFRELFVNHMKSYEERLEEFSLVISGESHLKDDDEGILLNEKELLEINV